MRSLNPNLKEFAVEVLNDINDFNTKNNGVAPKPSQLGIMKYMVKYNIASPTFYSRLEVMKAAGLLIKNKQGQGTDLFITIKGYAIINKQAEIQVETTPEEPTKIVKRVIEDPRDILIAFMKTVYADRDMVAAGFAQEAVEILDTIINESNTSRA